MTEQEFYGALESLLRMALTSGLRTIERFDVHPKDYSPREWRRFMTACHRGYAKAQPFMIDLLESIAKSDALSDDAKRRCHFLVRGVAETMALTVFGNDAYIVRRLSLFDEPTPVEFPVLRSALRDAERLNEESKLTFALLADLTVSIQIADIVRMDLRKSGRKYEFIELKRGRVNDELRSILDGISHTDQGLVDIDSHPGIVPRYKKQAKRMLRQQIRLEQVKEVLETDAGTDIKYRGRIQITPKAGVLSGYDAEVDSVLAKAASDGAAASIISEAIVVAASCGDVPDPVAVARAALSDRLGMLHYHLLDVAPDINAEVTQVLGAIPPYSTFNLFEMVLGRVAIRPPFAWRVDPEHVRRLVRRESILLSGFHLAGFLKIAREVGIEMRFASARETARYSSGIESEVPKWNGRALLRKSAGR